jgi:hypothetical protein
MEEPVANIVTGSKRGAASEVVEEVDEPANKKQKRIVMIDDDGDNDNNSSSTSSSGENNFPPTKPSRSWFIDKKVSLRSGFVEGVLCLRISTQNEVGEQYGSELDGIKKRYNMVVLISSEFFQLRSRFSKILKTKVDDDCASIDYTLTPKSDLEKLDRCVRVSVTDDGKFTIYTEFTGITTSKVVMTKDEFAQFDKALNSFWYVFKIYGHPQNDVLKSIIDTMYDLSAKMVVRSIRLHYHDELMPAFDEADFRSEFFRAYAEMSNMMFSTEVLKRVVAKFGEAVTKKYDLFTLFHQCVNQIDVLLNHIRERNLLE